MKEVGTKLNFGILLQGNVLKRWQLESIQKLIEAGHELKLVIHAEYAVNEAPAPTSKTSKYLGENALYNIYTKLFHKPFLNENIDVSEYLSSFPCKSTSVTRTGKYTDRFHEQEVKEIQEENLDFILRFGLNIIRGEILNAAKYGIWSLHHDDERIIRGGPPGFWEIAKKHAINGILLQRLTEELDAGIELKKAMVPIIQHSYKTHHNELLRIGIDMVVFTANELSIKGGISTTDTKEKQKGEMYYFPKNGAMLLFFFQLMMNKFSFHWKDLFHHENWNIGISKTSVEELFTHKKLNPINWHPKASNNEFYADGFICRNQDNELQILFENYNFKLQRATIDSCIYSESGFSASKTILKKDYHLSFPYILKEEGILSFMPEAYQSNHLRSYTLDTKQKEQLVMEEGAIDAVIFKKDELYWLFCTFKDAGSNLHLFGYYSEDLNTSWKAHALNPLVSDARKTRMAGEMIKYQNKLYRPAQINNITYGGGIQIMEIATLTPKAFEEKESIVLKANDLPTYSKGMHTISIQDDYILIDAKNNKFVFTEFVRKLKQKL